MPNTPRTDPQPLRERLVNEAVRRGRHTAEQARVSGAGIAGGQYVQPEGTFTLPLEHEDGLVYDKHIFLLSEDALGSPDAALGAVIA